MAEQTTVAEGLRCQLQVSVTEMLKVYDEAVAKLKELEEKEKYWKEQEQKMADCAASAKAKVSWV